MADQLIFGEGNIQALIKDSSNAHIEINERLTAQLLVPAFRRPVKGERRPDLDLLQAPTAITDFIGRGELWQDCLAWCDAALPISVRCITGQSGSGKTRFALELVHHLRSLPGWDARFVDFFLLEPFDFWAKTSGSNHVLLVFDQASDVIAPLAASLRRLANDPPKQAPRKLRLLLLARHADWDEGWLSALHRRSSIEAAVRDLFQPDQPLVLGPFSDADRLALYKQALKAAAAFTGSVEPPEPGAEIFAQSSSGENMRDPLSLIMAAVTAVRNIIPDPFALTRLELAYEVAGTLAQGIQAAFTDNLQLAHHMAAYVTICGGLSREEAQDALESEARANNMGVVLDPGGFVERLRAWLPGEQTEIGTIKPDIVGEAFVLGKKNLRIRRPEETLLRAVALHREPVLRTLIRMTQDFCLAEENARDEPLIWLQRVIEKGFADDFTLLSDIEAAVPDSTVVLQKHAAVVTLSLVQRLSKMIVEHSVADRSGVDLFAESAALLNNLSNRLSSLGVRDFALSSAVDSVGLYRSLVQIDRNTFLDGLAAALSTLANAAAGMGLLDDSLNYAEEAVALRREQAAGTRERWLHSLALSLITLANRQTERGLTVDALTSASESVSLYREGVQHDRDASLPHLAHSLTVLATAQSEQGLLKEANISSLEAVQLRRELLQRNRDAFLPGLAYALTNLSTTEGELGHHVEAIAAVQESVNIYRNLIGRGYEAFLPELAHALSALSLRQGDSGKRQEALASALGSTAIYRKLIQYNRNSYLPGLATSLVNLGKAQGDVGQVQDALSTVQEAVDLSEELVRKNRRAFLAQLALALNNLAAVQTIAGLWEGVVDTQQKAISCYRELSQESYSAYLPSLAVSLVTQAGLLTELGMPGLALAPAQEAVELYRELVRYSEDAFSAGLTRALVNFGRTLGEVQRIPEAIGIFEEAVSRARALVAKNRNGFLFELALALNNLAAMQNAHGLREASLQSIQESVSLYEELIRLYGNTYTVEYARSRHSLGVALASVGRFPEAFALFGVALKDLLSKNLATPQAKQIIQLLAGGYLSTHQRSGLELDRTLLSDVAQCLEQDARPEKDHHHD